ncbi:probable serine/threonine-protein kinase DDB_G0282963 [Varroa destructor]|uniref:Uncharacterized protein n=1 Tax=Varroa destructor TaxID=109461 RepID=A0A7M7J890_VARDE|nr:probable serine/threonine-protein kinase DDB_G0282963 [Varroa destructor]
MGCTQRGRGWRNINKAGENWRTGTSSCQVVTASSSSMSRSLLSAASSLASMKWPFSSQSTLGETALSTNRFVASLPDSSSSRNNSFNGNNNSNNTINNDAGVSSSLSKNYSPVVGIVLRVNNNDGMVQQQQQQQCHQQSLSVDSTSWCGRSTPGDDNTERINGHESSQLIILEGDFTLKNEDAYPIVTADNDRSDNDNNNKSYVTTEGFSNNSHEHTHKSGRDELVANSMSLTNRILLPTPAIARAFSGLGTQVGRALPISNNHNNIPVMMADTDGIVKRLQCAESRPMRLAGCYDETPLLLQIPVIRFETTGFAPPQARRAAIMRLMSRMSDNSAVAGSQAYCYALLSITTPKSNAYSSSSSSMSTTISTSDTATNNNTYSPSIEATTTNLPSFSSSVTTRTATTRISAIPTVSTSTILTITSSTDTPTSSTVTDTTQSAIRKRAAFRDTSDPSAKQAKTL